jgi:hypothetical protein
MSDPPLALHPALGPAHHRDLVLNRAPSNALEAPKELHPRSARFPPQGVQIARVQIPRHHRKSRSQAHLAVEATLTCHFTWGHPPNPRLRVLRRTRAAVWLAAGHLLGDQCLLLVDQ